MADALSEPFELAEPTEIECCDCGDTAEVQRFLKVAYWFEAPVGEYGETTWKPHNDGWICNECWRAQ